MRVINFKELKDLDVDIRSKLRLLSLVRVLIVTILLGTTIVFEIFDINSFVNTTLIVLYFIVGLTYFFSIFAIWLEKRNIIKKFGILSSSHIIWDILLASSIVFITGGMQSIFSFMYFFAIVNASVLRQRVGAFVAALFSFLFYICLLSIEYYWQISYSSLVYNIHYYPQASELLQMSAINFTAFFAIAVLSSYLAEQLSRTKKDLAKTSIDINRLKLLNKNIVESLNSGLITTDSSGTINFANLAVEKITGYTFSEIKNKNIKGFFTFVGDDILQEEKSTLEPFLPWKWEDNFVKKNGNKVYLGVNRVKLRDADGKEEGQIIVFQDLTQFKMLEEKIKRADRLAAVGKLAEGIAHEIRNPLASVSGSTQLLRELCELKDKRLFNIILRETDRLNGLITGFLMFVKPPPLKLERISPKNIIDEIIKSITSDLNLTEGIELKIENRASANIHADYLQIKQALLNVIKNALEAMVENGILTIEVQNTKIDDKDTEFVEFRIIDTGIGIDPSNMGRIFDPFFTTKPRVPGLGLATTYKIVELHNGDISIESVPNKGTIVTIKIPKFRE